MDANALDILITASGAKHSIVAWFEQEHDGRIQRFAAMFDAPDNVNEAREWLMKGSQATRRLLHDRKAPYAVKTDGPLFASHRAGEHPIIVARGSRLFWMDVPQ